MRTLLRVLLPLVVLAAGVLIAAVLAGQREVAPRGAPARVVPPVEVVVAEPSTVTLSVRAHGTVRPAVETQLTAEVTGRILEVAPGLRLGAAFAAGEVLVRIDPRDFEVQVAAARAEVARAKLTLELEKAEAEAARREWRELGHAGEPSALAVRAPQLAEAEALVLAAEARLEAAERDVERTTIRAPYDGRVLEAFVDVGQFVTTGTRLARVCSTASAEVRLPVPDEDLAFLDVDVHDLARGAGRLPEVTLRSDFAGRVREWHGRIARMEGAIDPGSRMVPLVAVVDAPYERDSNDAPLLVGMFVAAEIRGRRVEDVFALPAAALRGAATLLVVTEASTITIRPVEVLRRERDRVLVRGGLAAGERVCTTPLDVIAEGMEVRVVDADDPSNGAGTHR